jgi:hypothetical protein
MNPQEMTDNQLLTRLDYCARWRTEYSTNASHNQGYLPEEEAQAAADNEREYDALWNEAYDRCLLPDYIMDYDEESD